MPHLDQCNLLIGLPAISLLSNPFSSVIMEKEVEVTLKSRVFAARSVLESPILHLLAVRSWLQPHFLIFKIEIIIIPVSYGSWEDELR